MVEPAMSDLEVLLGADEAMLRQSQVLSPGNELQSSTGQRLTTIPCCLCGVQIYPNAANQCGACLAQQFDLKAFLNRGPGGGELSVHQCRECRRFERQPGKYEACRMESSELMSLCLKCIPALQRNYSVAASEQGAGIDNIKVADAAWVWTEPHSMRLRLKLTVRAGVVNGGVQVQQTIMVTFMVRFQQCPECKREYTSRTWQAVVQLRQKRPDGSPRKGIFLVETAIRSNKELRQHILNFETARHGFDFYFLHLHQAQNFSQFLSKVVPIRVKTTSKLVSTDNHSNTANIKYTITCDMVPFGRDDLIVVTRSGGPGGGVDNGMGKLNGTLSLVLKCKSLVHLVSAAPSRTSMYENMTELNPDKYWKAGEERCFRILLSPQRLVRFVVLDVELCSTDSKAQHQGNENLIYQGPQSGIEQYTLADFEVVRESDFGNNDAVFHCVSHLGHLVQVGDTVLGYDLQASIDAVDILENMSQYFHSNFTLPDVVLVRKVPGDAVADELNNDAEIKSKAKSSASKKRERRKKKEEKKMQDLEKAAYRMGLAADGPDPYSSDRDEEPDFAEGERFTLEKELATDDDLRDDLRMVEAGILEEIQKSGFSTRSKNEATGSSKGSAEET